MRSNLPSSSSRAPCRSTCSARHAGLDGFEPLKQNPLTRHIPVQIITLDEDRQHALARGAFSFVTKPTRRKASMPRSPGSRNTPSRVATAAGVEDNPAEQLSIRELLNYDDIEIDTADRTRRADQPARAAI